MNEDIIGGKWEEMRDAILQKWDKLTDQKLDEIQGNRKRLVKLLQQTYGYAEEDAAHQIRVLEQALCGSGDHCLAGKRHA